MKKESIVYVVLITFIASFFFVFLISLVDRVTAERIDKNQQLITAESFLNSIGKVDLEGEAALDAYNNYFEEDKETAIQKVQIDGQSVMVKRFEGQGLWGTITGVIASDAEASRLLGLEFISHSETPGLGGRIDEAWFKNQFRNEIIGPNGIEIRKGEGGEDRESENALVDGLTGATLTSNAVETIINNEIKLLQTEADK